ncbi:MAG: hypothetical protein JWN05_440 [Arthrobacter sp.]|jgi:hypothetical protein|nr:hypothetical protein [Arthrobacter sp.]
MANVARNVVTHHDLDRCTVAVKETAPFEEPVSSKCCELPQPSLPVLPSIGVLAWAIVAAGMSAVRARNAFVDDLACKPSVSPPHRLFTGAGLKLPSQTALDPDSPIIVTSMMAPAQISMTATVISVAVIGSRPFQAAGGRRLPRTAPV